MSKAETNNILSKLYTFSQLGLYTKMEHFFSSQQIFWVSATTLIKQMLLPTARSFGSHGKYPPAVILKVTTSTVHQFAGSNGKARVVDERKQLVC